MPKNILENEYYPQKIEKKWFDIWEKTKPHKVENKSEQKIKKDGNGLTLKLVENPDILAEMSKIKKANCFT